jgi:hypothetical protein
MEERIRWVAWTTVAIRQPLTAIKPPAVVADSAIMLELLWMELVGGSCAAEAGQGRLAAEDAVEWAEV